MASRVKALVSPQLLTWARESAGLSVHQAAKKTRVSTEKLTAWEAGEDSPTVKQLRKMAHVYKRPLTVFYLPDPPRDFQALRDFRRLPGQIAGSQSPELRYQIRRAHEQREIALELAEQLGEPRREFSLRARPSEDEPEALAERIRAELRINLEEQYEQRPDYGSLNFWRSALERAEVLVFQFQGVQPSEARGFSIAQGPLPVIAVNIKDFPNGRVFSMIHELCHVMLREGGLCDVDEEERRPPEVQRVEVFCNQVSGAVLVPQEALLAEKIVQASRRKEWSDDDLRSLARKFGVSREVILRRLLFLGRTTKGFYRQKREDFKKEYQRLAERKKPGFVPRPELVVARAGHTFIGLVLTSYHEGHITASDVADFLDVRLKHLDTIQAEVYGLRRRASA